MTGSRARLDLVATVASAALCGAAPVAALTVSPLTHSFLDTDVGSSSEVRLSTVSHTTGGNITVVSIAESCDEFAFSAETVYFSDGVEVDRQVFAPGDLVFRFVDSELDLVEQQVVEIFFVFSPLAPGAAPACLVDVTTSSATDPTVTLNGTGLEADPDLIFRDGFESSGTTRWS